MRHHGYTAIPVITRDNKYIGTVSEGDFLWYLVDTQSEELHRISMKNIEDTLMRDVLRIDRNAPVKITAGMDELLDRVMNQNFVPVVDDLGSFIGIVTRRDIIDYFYKESRQTQRGAR